MERRDKMERAAKRKAVGHPEPAKRDGGCRKVMYDVRRLREWEREFGELDGEPRPAARRGRSRRRRGRGTGRLAAALARIVVALILVIGLFYAGLRFYHRMSGDGRPVTTLESSREIVPETMESYQ